MKRVLTSLLWLAAVSAGADTLALVVHYDQGDVGEEHRVFTTSYYTNDEGLLVRKVLVVQGEYGDPDTTYERTYRWDKDGVRWSTDENPVVPLPRSLRFSDQGLVRTIGDDVTPAPDWAGPPKVLRYLDAERSSWTDGQWVHGWTLRGGYQESLADGPFNQLLEGDGWSTRGASLVERKAGVEQNRVILDRRPKRIHGVFTQDNQHQTGWDVTGELDVSGPGLWHTNPVVRLAHMSILDDDRNLAYAAPLVWNSDYLH